MSSSKRKCKNSPNSFCYICGRFLFDEDYEKRPITDELCKLYKEYFGDPIGDQDKSWAPHVVCYNCVRGLRSWKSGHKKQMPFGIPMVWREPSNHQDCYFCKTATNGINKKNRKSITYFDLKSAKTPVKHCDEIPIPKPSLFESSFEIHDDAHDSAFDMDSSFVDPEQETQSKLNPILFTDEMLDDLIRNLGLSILKATLLARILKGYNLLEKGCTYTRFQTRQKLFTPFFKDEGSLTYCSDVE